MALHHRQTLFIALVALLTCSSGALLARQHPEGLGLLVTGLLLAALAVLPLVRQVRRPRPVSFSQHSSESQ